MSFAAVLGDRIQPSLSLREVYESNIFRVRDKGQLVASIGDDQLADSVTIYSMGLDARYPVSRQEAAVTLRKDFLRHGHYVGQDSDQDDVRGKLSFRMLDRVHAEVAGGYMKVLEPRENYRTQGRNERTTRANRVSLGYTLPSGLDLFTAFGWEAVDFSLSALVDRETTRRDYSGGVSYSPSPDTGFDTFYARSVLEYPVRQTISGNPVNNDSTGDAVKVGLRRTLSPKTQVSLQSGYLWKRHEAFRARDFSGTVGRVEATYVLTGKLQLFLTSERRLSEEIFQDQIYSVNVDGGYGVRYRPTEKIEAFLSGNVSRKSFRGDSAIVMTASPVRKDSGSEFKTGVAWSPVRHLDIDLRYRYTTRHSNFDLYDYNDSMIEQSIRYTF